ncbi:MAG: hypothetical protein NC118_03625 [Eubacterium sp.]|nr:hypothetical protein [Eubacterium sp.]
MIKNYIFRKTGEKESRISMSSETAFQKLEEILEGIRRGTDIYGRGKTRQDDCFGLVC